MQDTSKKFSVVIPAFNEESSIKNVLINLFEFLDKNIGGIYEVIIVNDGSIDNTADVLKSINNKKLITISNPYNQGYGASLKKGVNASKGDFIIFYDADGQHNPEDVLKLIKYSEDYDMIVGSRQDYNGPNWRKPGKKILNIIANYLANYKIPDINSGLRLVKKECFNRFHHLYPNGFSLSTTITLAFIKHGYSVKYLPININKRKEGKSYVKISDGLKAVNLILRMIMLFSPLRIFVPISAFLFIVSLGFLGNDIFYHHNIADATLLLLISALLIFLFGLLADQVAAMRREKHN